MIRLEGGVGEPFCCKGGLGRLDFILYRIALRDAGWQVTFGVRKGASCRAMEFRGVAKCFVSSRRSNLRNEYLGEDRPEADQMFPSRGSLESTADVSGREPVLPEPFDRPVLDIIEAVREQRSSCRQRDTLF